MYIDLCIVSSDMNKNYVGLYPYVRKAWNKLGIKTMLILVSDVIPNFLIEYKDEIILFEPIKGIHTAFQAQTVRLLYPSLIHNKNVLISDMDIIPLSKKYFVDNIRDIQENNHIIFRNSYMEQNMYAVCYHLSHSDIWKKIFNISNLDDIKNTMIKWYDPNYTGSKNCTGWFTDQLVLYTYINQNIPDQKIILDDNKSGFKRLDKRNKQYIVSNREDILKDINKSVYSDFHVIRPYYKHIPLINNIIDSINI